jgi:enoyl-CoA hydratase/carnithine racemase
MTLSSEFMKNDHLLVTTEGHVCTLILNRPEKRNSLTPDLLNDLTRTLENLTKTDTVRALIIRGAGDNAFCAGFDLGVLPTGEAAKNGQSAKKLNPFEEAMKAIGDFPYPVIAMLNGYAFGGGCDLAVSCDIRIGADDIKIGMVPAKLGVVYSAAGLSRFIAVLGLARTKELFFTGRHYSAAALKEIGFLNHVLPKEELEPFTHAMAREISENAPLSLKGTKRVLKLLTQTNTMGERELEEAERISLESFLSSDLKEGQTAFFEKRKPVFKGR